MALRALKTDEEISAIPLTEPVLVELPSLPTGTTDDDADTVRTEPAKGREKIADGASDDGAQKLKEQLDALNAANERAERAERAEAEARRLASATEAENRALKVGRVEDEGALIQNGLSAAQADERAAQAEYEKAFENGDAKAAAAAQSKIARASAKIVQYENAAAQHAEEQERIARAPKPEERTQPAYVDPISAIDANPQLLPAEKQWLKGHLDAWTNPKKNQELAVAYNRSIDAGLSRGSAEQFKFIEEFLGYEKPSTQERDVSVGAPPSRDNRGGDGRPVSPNRVTLTPEEREIARSMGVSDIDYARQKVNFDAARKADPDKYR